MRGTAARVRQNAPGLGDATKANLAGRFVEVPVVIGTPAITVRVDQDQLLGHGVMIAGRCDGKAGPDTEGPTGRAPPPAPPVASGHG